jgi:hypothetical protein
MLPPVGGLEDCDDFALDLVTREPRRLGTPYGLVTALAREGNCCALAVSAGAAD